MLSDVGEFRVSIFSGYGIRIIWPWSKLSLYYFLTRTLSQERLEKTDDSGYSNTAYNYEYIDFIIHALPKWFDWDMVEYYITDCTLYDSHHSENRQYTYLP